MGENESFQRALKQSRVCSRFDGEDIVLAQVLRQSAIEAGLGGAGGVCGIESSPEGETEDEILARVLLESARAAQEAVMEAGDKLPAEELACADGPTSEELRQLRIGSFLSIQKSAYLPLHL